jgi:predicted enzyme related to lactoylglutathione lyase
MINSIAFTVYPVSNMKKAQHFYEGVLGLKKTYDFQNKWVEYDIGSGTFAITTTEMGHAPGAKGAIVGFELDDLDGFVSILKGKSVPFVVEPIDTPVCRIAVIEDPDHNHITLHKRKG